MSETNDFWRYVHEPGFMRYVNPNRIAPLHNNITHEWPGLLTVRMNPISGAIAPCSGDTACFGNWFDGPIIPTSNIDIGPLEPPLSPQRAAIEPVDYKNSGSASLPPSTPQGNPLPITTGQLTTGCTACGNKQWTADEILRAGYKPPKYILDRITAWLKQHPGGTYLQYQSAYGGPPGGDLENEAGWEVITGQKFLSPPPPGPPPQLVSGIINISGASTGGAKTHSRSAFGKLIDWLKSKPGHARG